MAQPVFCTVADLQSILGESGVVRRVDDREDRVVSQKENQYVADAIDQAATEINLLLQGRYRLAGLTGHSWLRWCNAYLAASVLSQRRGNRPCESIEKTVEDYRQRLREMRAGQLDLADVDPQHSIAPRVSTYQVCLGDRRPVRAERDVAI